MRIKQQLIALLALALLLWASQLSKHSSTVVSHQSKIDSKILLQLAYSKSGLGAASNSTSLNVSKPQSNAINVEAVDRLKQEQENLNIREKKVVEFSFLDSEHSPNQPIAPTTVFCGKNPHLCATGQGIKNHIRSRVRYSDKVKSDIVRILIDEGVFSFFGRPRFLSAEALKECPRNCTVTTDGGAFDVIFYLFNAQQTLGPGKAVAVLNMEPHSFDSLPTSQNNLALMSFHAESDVVANYGYSVMHSLGLCVGDAPGTRDNGEDRCENMRERNSSFYRWCADTHGDFFTCVFDIVPHVVRAGGANKSGDALAVAWISQTCGRHDDYLLKLTRALKMDSMGACHRSRDELAHPGLQAEDRDGIWWGKGRPPPIGGTGVRKMLMASHYKFFVSLENTIMDDYVTEKFYEGFMADTLMVYLGAPNAERYAPAPHSFVNAHDFEGPEALAAHLVALAADTARYDEYFAWRRARPVRVTEEFVRSMSNDMVRRDSVSVSDCAQLLPTLSLPPSVSVSLSVCLSLCLSVSLCPSLPP